MRDLEKCEQCRQADHDAGFCLHHGMEFKTIDADEEFGKCEVEKLDPHWKCFSKHSDAFLGGPRK